MLDGVLDDACWSAATAIGEFVQREPADGLPASELTTARFLFDGSSIYVGIVAHDREPDRINAPVHRQDVTTDSDWVAVDFDTFSDRQSGYRFGLTAAGARLDATLGNDTGVDWSWDAVWTAATTRTGSGWAAELRIPLAILRFGRRPDWGVNVVRRIARKNETATWSPAPRSEPGWVSRFGRLEGLTVTAFVPTVEADSYGLARAMSDDPDGTWSYGSGLDLRWAATPGWRLTATLNPDFGQVEADPAVLNLTSFETFFPEKRPFFVEGADVFRTPYRLFFSRRIGRAPPAPGLGAGEQVVRTPSATRVVEAVRVTSQSADGWIVGLLQAGTSAASARIRTAAGTTADRIVAASANFTVVRAQRRFGASNVGLLATGVHRVGEPPIWTGGLDWDLRFAERRYGFDGQLAGSRAPVRGARDSGTGLVLNLRRLAGEHLTGGVSLAAESPGFQLNDLGFISRNDHVATSTWANLQWLEPGAVFRQAYLAGSAWHNWNWAETRPLRRGFQLGFDGELTAQHWIGAGLSREIGSYDDRQTRGGPTVATTGSWDVWTYFNTDSARPWWLTVDGNLARQDDGGWSHGYGMTVGVRPNPRLELQLGASFWRGLDRASWLENRDGDGDGAIDHVLYAALESRTVDFNTRAKLALSAQLTIEFYMQPFLAVGDYRDFRELIEPLARRFSRFDPGYDPDFSSLSLYSNLLVRWEYRTGSHLTLAWSQSRAATSDPGELRVGRDLDRLFGADGSHALAVKLTHHF